MIKQYFKQAWQLLKDNPVLSTISIIGTALAICMIMVMVMSHEVKNAPYAPETNRDRMLYVKWITSAYKENNESNNNGAISYKYAKEAFKELKTPETVTIVGAFATPTIVSALAEDMAYNHEKRLTDDAFWQVFDFAFIDGKPYTKADVDAGLRKVVINETIAREVFGSTNVTGKSILIDYTEYTVSGVVKDVSTLATAAYAQLWAPITSDNLFLLDEGITGNSRVYILAKSKKDFPAIREEAETLRLKFNDASTTNIALYRDQPDTQFVYNHRKWSNVAPNIKVIVRQSIIVLALLLIIPAINLSGMMNSSMRKRLAELGVRRAFGATRVNLLSQVMWESMLQTLLGGLLGLILSFIAAYALKGIIYEDSNMAYMLGEATINPLSLLSPAIFLYAFLFCLLLNVLSAFVPAYNVSRKPIVDSIHSK